MTASRVHSRTAAKIAYLSDVANTVNTVVRPRRKLYFPHASLVCGGRAGARPGGAPQALSTCEQLLPPPEYFGGNEGIPISDSLRNSKAAILVAAFLLL